LYSVLSGIPPSKDEVSLSQLQSKDDVSNQVLDDEDDSKLRRVTGKIPMAVWLLSIASICERFAYYAFLGPLRTKVLYIQGIFADADTRSPRELCAESIGRLIDTGCFGIR
jgi:hypothetical protein